MSIDRLARVNELLRREIGGALYHVLKDYEVDLAAVTITHVITTRNLRSARVLVSIRDHRGERDRIISRLRRHRAEIQAIINRNMTLKYTPKLMFALVSAIVHRRINTRCRRCTLLLHGRFVGLASSSLAVCLRSAGITWVTIWKPDLCEPQ